MLRNATWDEIATRGGSGRYMVFDPVTRQRWESDVDFRGQGLAHWPTPAGEPERVLPRSVLRLRFTGPLPAGS